MAADSTMLRMVKRLMALSLGVHREQLLHRIGLTWPRPFLLRPLFFLFFTMIEVLLFSSLTLKKVRRRGGRGKEEVVMLVGFWGEERGSGGEGK